MNEAMANADARVTVHMAASLDGFMRFRSIWVVGGGAVCGECLRRGLADEVRYSILPILIGDGIAFFERIGRDVPLHLLEVKAYQSGVVALRYEVKRPVAECCS